MHHPKLFSMSVWYGIWNGQLISPVFYEGILIVVKYIDITLNIIVTDILEKMPLSLVKNTHFQQYCTKILYKFLEGRFLEKELEFLLFMRSCFLMLKISY